MALGDGDDVSFAMPGYPEALYRFARAGLAGDACRSARPGAPTRDANESGTRRGDPGAARGGRAREGLGDPRQLACRRRKAGMSTRSRSVSS